MSAVSITWCLVCKSELNRPFIFIYIKPGKRPVYFFAVLCKEVCQKWPIKILPLK
uniref:Uncharacterized protein n=1 Tax=Anguilla anguilla TaxID=7936 RepID=A0A0E9RII0_ANGAN